MTDNNKATVIYYLLEVHTFILLMVCILYLLTALKRLKKMCSDFYVSQVTLATLPGGEE